MHMRNLVLNTSIVLLCLGAPVWADMVPVGVNFDTVQLAAQDQGSEEHGLFGQDDFAPNGFFTLDFETIDLPSDEQAGDPENEPVGTLAGLEPVLANLGTVAVNDLNPVDLSDTTRDFVGGPVISREVSPSVRNSMGPSQVPSPGATMLALIGLPAILLVRRRVA